MSVNRKSTFLFSLLLLGAAYQVHAADIVYEPVGKSNNKTIYLSPAKHSDTTKRGECRGQSENFMAYVSSIYTAAVPNKTNLLKGLRYRGYRVIIGNGNIKTAVARSNAANATLHIPIHSNGRPDSCNTTRTGPNGTVVLYLSWGSRKGQGLAEILKTQVGNNSPGTGDKTCHNIIHNCTKIKPLYELDKTRATAAYLETEFHTWNRGVDFLRNYISYYYRIAEGVDSFLRYPR